jgi:hypothetical protein
MKTCRTCQLDKAESEFYKRSDNDKLMPDCKSCKNAATTAWRKANPEATKSILQRANRKRHYGVSAEQYDSMLAAQNNRCAICETDKPGGKGTWHVDHNHMTQLVRGLLCHSCNLALGHMQDDPDRLLSAAAYVLIHQNVLDSGNMVITSRRDTQ